MHTFLLFCADPFAYTTSTNYGLFANFSSRLSTGIVNAPAAPDCPQPAPQVVTVPEQAAGVATVATLTALRAALANNSIGTVQLAQHIALDGTPLVIAGRRLSIRTRAGSCGGAKTTSSGRSLSPGLCSLDGAFLSRHFEVCRRICGPPCPIIILLSRTSVIVRPGRCAR